MPSMYIKLHNICRPGPKNNKNKRFLRSLVVLISLPDNHYITRGHEAHRPRRNTAIGRQMRAERV